MLTESEDVYRDYFPEFESVPAAKVAQAFIKSIEGAHTGKVYEP